MEIEIYLDDLKPEVQKRVLQELGLESARDGNYDVFPLFTLVSAQTGQTSDQDISEDRTWKTEMK